MSLEKKDVYTHLMKVLRHLDDNLSIVIGFAGGGGCLFVLKQTVGV